MTIKSLLFDLGGTLVHRDVDDHSTDETAVKDIVDYLNLKGLMVDQECFLEKYWSHYKRLNEYRENFMIEIPMTVWLSELLHNVCGENLDSKLLSKAEKTIIDARVESAIILPKTIEILEELSSRYDLGMITNTSSEKVTDRVLMSLKLNKFFDCVIASSEVGVRKPYPGIFFHIIREMFIKPEETLFIGDSIKHDIVGSNLVNMKSCLIGQKCLESSNISCIPDLSIMNLSDLLRIDSLLNR
ncbi:HAD family hydrolase [[Eubacterium] cellulosolvens]